MKSGARKHSSRSMLDQNELDLSDKNLDQIPIIYDDVNKEFFTKLNLSDNLLESLENITQFGNLVHLNVDNNHIESFSQVYLLRKIRGLKSLSIVNNPLSIQMEFKNVAIEILPQLTALNGLPITQNDREKSKEYCRRNFGLLQYLYQNMVNIVICVKLKKILMVHEELRIDYPAWFGKTRGGFNPELFFKELTKSASKEKRELEFPFKMDLLDDIQLIAEDIEGAGEFMYDKAIMDLMQRQLNKIESIKDEITAISLAQLEGYEHEQEEEECKEEENETPRMIQIEFQNYPELKKSPQFGGIEISRANVDAVSSFYNGRSDVRQEDTKSFITDVERYRANRHEANRSFTCTRANAKIDKGRLRNSSYYNSAAKHRVDFSILQDQNNLSAGEFYYNFAKISKNGPNLPLVKAQKKLKQATEIYLQKEKEFTYIKQQLENSKKSLKDEDKKIKRLRFRMKELEELRAMGKMLEDLIEDKMVDLKEVEEKKMEYLKEAEELNEVIGAKEDLKGKIKEQLMEETDQEISTQFRNHWLKKKFFVWIKKHRVVKEKVLYLENYRDWNLKRLMFHNWIRSKLQLRRLNEIASNCRIVFKKPVNSAEEVFNGIKGKIEIWKNPRMLFLCFFKLREYVKYRKERRQLKDMADEYNDFCSLRKVFNTLKINRIKQKKAYSIEEDIVLTAKGHLAKYRQRLIFQSWKNSLEIYKESYNIPFEKIQNFRKKISAKKIFKVFKANSLLIDDNYMKIKEVRNQKLKKFIFRIWTKELLPLQRKLKYWQRRRVYSMRKKVLKNWKKEIVRERFMNKRKDIFVTKRNFIRFKMCFKALRINRYENMRERMNEERAIEFYSKKCKKKILEKFFLRFKFLRAFRNLRRIRERREMRLRINDMRRYEQIKFRNLELKENLNFFKDKQRQRRKSNLLAVWREGSILSRVKRVKIENFEERRDRRMKEKSIRLLKRYFLTAILNKRRGIEEKKLFNKQLRQKVIEDLTKKSNHFVHNKELIYNLQKRFEALRRKNEVLTENKKTNNSKIEEEQLKIEDLLADKKRLTKVNNEVCDEIIEEVEDCRSKVQKLEEEVQDLSSTVANYESEIRATEEIISNANQTFTLLETELDTKAYGFESSKEKINDMIDKENSSIEQIKELQERLAAEIEKKRNDLLCLRKHNIKLEYQKSEIITLAESKSGDLKSETEVYLAKQIELSKVKNELIDSCRIIKKESGVSHNTKKVNILEQSKAVKVMSEYSSSDALLKKARVFRVNTTINKVKKPIVRFDKISKSQPNIPAILHKSKIMRSEVSQLSDAKPDDSKLSSLSSRTLPGGKAYLDGFRSKNIDSRSIQERMRMLQLCMDHDLSSFN